MSTTKASNLYPPVIETFMPAFVGDSCNIIFSLSQFNQPSNIKHVQLKISRQDSNKNGLNKGKYPNEIAVFKYPYEDKDNLGTNPNQIILSSTDLQSGFELDTFYKIQLRFDKADFTPTQDSPQPDATWFSENLENFSEWSTVCLIRRIKEPTVIFTIPETISSPTLVVQGGIDFNGSDETLKSYNIELIGNDINIKTDILYPDYNTNENSFYYAFKEWLYNGNYKIKFNYETKNLYSAIEEYDITISYSEDPSVGKIIAIPNENNGLIQLNISEIPIGTNVYVKRASEVSNFTVYDTVAVFKDGQSTEYLYNDIAIESGEFYKYFIQIGKDAYSLSKPSNPTDATIVLLDDMFLSAYHRQLKIKYNPTVNSYNRTILEGKTDTIGSAYPFIRRNGLTNYLTIPISGLIFSEMDDDELFLTKDELYEFQEVKKLYEDYNYNHNISKYQDFVYEKKFREAVMTFLHSDHAFLFRSPTEGNHIVRLMNVTLTPEKTLGRMVYSFSCNAIEIAECTPDNILKYDLGGNLTDKILNSTDYIYAYENMLMKHKDDEIFDIEGIKVVETQEELEEFYKNKGGN